MYYGLQLAASGILTGMYRTDALANNLANINTSGFKPDMVFTRQRSVVREEDGVRSLPSNALLERLGAGAHLAPNQVDFAQGSIDVTGNELDVAIHGDGFLVVRDLADGATDALRFTRDGRLTQDRDRRLVLASSGLPVIGVSGQPITLGPRGRVSIDTDGVVRQQGAVLGRLQLLDVPDRRQLTRTAGNLFVPSASAYSARTPGTGRLVQGSIEKSSVSDVGAILAFQEASRAASGSIRIAQYHDDLMNRVINTFGRIG